MGLFRPTNTWRISVFRALRFHQSASVSSALCFPHCFPSLYGFLPWSAWVPLPLGRSDLRSSTTSLRLGPLSAVFPRTGFRFEIQSSLGALLLVNRASLVARFHPRPALATLLTFCLPLRYLASSAPLESQELCLSHLGVRLLRGFSAPSKLASLGCPSDPPSMGFLPSTLSSN